MTNQTKALRAHRKRIQTRGLRRVEVTVRANDVRLVREVAAELRENNANAKRIRAALRDSLAPARGTSLAEALYDPVVARPEFDDVFEEIERSRHDPAMLKMRDVDL